MAYNQYSLFNNDFFRANGCNGATIGAYQQYLASAGGTVSHEAQYPYLDRDPNLYCANKPKWNTGAKVSRAVIDYRCDEDKLKQLVYKYGAVATGIYASDPGFSNTYKGVFSGCSTKSINHAVTVVGWGTQNGTPYWIVKNSWGSSWGDGGYIKIRRGSSECGIGGNCAATECTYTGGYTPAPVAPPPPPIPPNQICDISSLYGRSDITGNYTLTTRSKNLFNCVCISIITNKYFSLKLMERNMLLMSNAPIPSAALELLVPAMLACTFVERFNANFPSN